MASSFDVTDPEDLKRSMAAWKGRLAREQASLKRHQKAIAAAQKAMQQAQAMVDRRASQIKKIPTRPRRKAVHVALSYVGTTESPPNSNRGKLVDLWQSAFHMVAQPWCGAFVGFMCRAAGAKEITDRIVYTPYIYLDAAAGRNGLDHVVWERNLGFVRSVSAQPGDLVLFDFGSGGIKHVGMVVKAWHGIGPIQTVEGNTSFGSAGSQSNGGAVARRSREKSLVKAIVAVKW